jgi:hypothetical protein
MTDTIIDDRGVGPARSSPISLMIQLYSTLSTGVSYGTDHLDAALDHYLLRGLVLQSSGTGRLGETAIMLCFS